MVGTHHESEQTSTKQHCCARRSKGWLTAGRGTTLTSLPVGTTTSHMDCSTAIKRPSDSQNERWPDFGISSSYTLQPQEFCPITQLESNRPWKGQIPVFFTNRWRWIDLKCQIQDNAHLDWIRFFICLLSYVSIFLSTCTPQNHKLTKRKKKK